MAWEKKHKHLDYIQAAITRMANNSFLIKGWNITLISALLAFANKEHSTVYLYIAFLPLTLFWILDGYYLWQERLFRGLYQKVKSLTNDDDVDYDMNTAPLTGGSRTWTGSMFSKTVLIFYGTVLALILFGIKLLT